MELIDTHCHLTFDIFESDFDEVLVRARENGITKIIVPGLNLASSIKAVELASKNQELFAAIGIHPAECDEYNISEIAILSDLAKSEKVVAIGEIGLDYYHRTDNKELQKTVLLEMLKIARNSQKPVIFHSRKALSDLIKIVLSFSNVAGCEKLCGVFHAFEGDFTQARQIIDMGFFIGIGGPVTFRNALDKQILITKVGLEHVILETDSPFLSPDPYRGKRNEPSQILTIAKKVSELLETDLEEVAFQTSNNANHLFSWGIAN